MILHRSTFKANVILTYPYRMVTMKNIPWFLLAFIALSIKAVGFSLNLPESLLAVGLVAYHAYLGYVAHNDQEKLNNELLKRLAGIDKEIEDRFSSIEGKLGFRNVKPNK